MRPQPIAVYRSPLIQPLQLRGSALMLSAPWTLGRRTVVRGLLVLALASCTGVASAFAGAPAPVIDGNGEDIITFAAGIGSDGCAIDRTDARDDIAIDDPKIIVCAPKE